RQVTTAGSTIFCSSTTVITSSITPDRPNTGPDCPGASRPIYEQAGGRQYCAGWDISTSTEWSDWFCARQRCNGSCSENTNAPFAHCCHTSRAYAAWKSWAEECFRAPR